MVLDKLGEGLRGTLDKIKNALFVDEKLINELIRDIQKSLLQSDVNVKLVFELTKNIKEKALKEDVPKNLSKKEYLIKVVYEELVQFLGGEGAKININKKPFYIMLVGLFGSGKTTHAGKLAKYYQKRGYKVGLISTDTWRPAAYEQLQQLSQKVGVDFYGIKGEKDPVKIFRTYMKELDKYDIILVDTAGRDALNDELIEELNKIQSIVNADEKLLVISADIGQAAEKQARTFHDTCGVTGVIITKLDGTAKGGGALTACSVTGAPVKFIGVGEKIDALEEFNPQRFVGRILGMGDLETLLEKVNDAISEEDAKDLGKKFLKGEFNLIDLYEQMQAMKKMGPLTKVMELIPGMGGLKIPKDMLESQEIKLEKWKYAMQSMTKDELEDPEIIDASRAERISKGSGMTSGEVRELVKQYKQSKKLIRMMKGNEKGMEKMMKNMQSGQVKF
jgi:signal recognition particle subunit SRP54